MWLLILFAIGAAFGGFYGVGVVTVAWVVIELILGAAGYYE